MKMDDKRVCVEFVRQMGSSWYFFEQFKLLQDELKDLDDVVI